jgi:hypothetical protein
VSRCARRSAALALALLAGGCSSTYEMRRVALPPRLEWLREGITTRDLTLTLLGEPDASFEGGRIATWELEADGSRGPAREAPEPQWAPRSLVVVFDTGGRAVRVSLVQTW